MFSFFAALTTLITISPQYIASTIICTRLAFKKKCHKFQVVITELLLHDHKQSRRRGMIKIVKKLLKFQRLNNVFHWNLNQIGQIKIFCEHGTLLITFTSSGKAMNY